MALTVRDILRNPSLDVRLVAGGKGQGSAIRWVHVSELEDPTPWLRGGELLLTTGMGVGKTPPRQRAYLDRLRAANLAGLGFGTGLSFRRVPAALINAAERASFPVFEVPYAVPFIAITEAVFTRLVAEGYDVLSRSLEAEHALTRAVLDGPGVEGVVAALTRAIKGWAVILDPHGEVISAVPGSARTYVPRLWAAMESPRSEGQRFSMSLTGAGQHVAIQPVAAQGRVEAYLIVGKRQALTQFDRIVSSHALSLLALELAKARAVSDAERRLKGDLLDQIMRGALAPGEARLALERLGFDLSRPLAPVILAGTDSVDALAIACEEAMARQPLPFMASVSDDVVLLVVQRHEPGFLSALRNEVAARLSGTVLAGSGRSVGFDQLPEGVREARYALQLCRAEGRLHAEFADLGTYQLLLSLQAPEALRAFADSVLSELDAYDLRHGGVLLPSLRTFLERNARWESAAKELFVHRHTLRYRMRKVEDLTGRDLDSSGDRMEFLMALRARDMIAPGEFHRAPTRNPRNRVRSKAAGS